MAPDHEEPLHPISGNKKKVERAAKTICASIHGICALGLTGKLDVVGAESVQVLTDGLIDNYIKGMES